MDGVVQDDRLGAANEDRGRRVLTNTVAGAAGLAVRVEIDHAVGNADVRLVDLHGVEAVETAFDGRQTAGVGDQGIIQTPV